MKMNYITVKSGFESLEGAYTGQFVSNGTIDLDGVAKKMCVNRPAIDEPEVKLAMRALAAEIKEQVGNGLYRVNAGMVSFEPAISGSLPSMDASLTEENELYVNIVASESIKREIGAVVPTRSSANAVKVILDNVEDVEKHVRKIFGIHEFVVTGTNLSARLPDEGMELLSKEGNVMTEVRCYEKDGMGQRIFGNLPIFVPSGVYTLQLKTHGYSTPDADVETYTKKVEVVSPAVLPEIQRVTSSEGENTIKIGSPMTIEGVGFDIVEKIGIQYITTDGDGAFADCPHTFVDANTISVATVPELPKVDLSQPVEIDIIDAERYVLFYLEVTAVA
jgi:hypothetical protein